MSTLASSIMQGLQGGSALARQAHADELRRRGMIDDQAYRQARLAMEQQQQALAAEREKRLLLGQQQAMDQQQADRDFLVSQLVGDQVPGGDAGQYGPYQPGSEPSGTPDALAQYADRMSIGMLKGLFQNQQESLAKTALDASKRARDRERAMAILDAHQRLGLDDTNAFNNLMKNDLAAYVHDLQPNQPGSSGQNDSMLQDMIDKGFISPRDGALLGADAAGFDIPASMYGGSSQTPLSSTMHSVEAPHQRELSNMMGSIRAKIALKKSMMAPQREIETLQAKLADLESQQAQIDRAEYQQRRREHPEMYPGASGPDYPYDPGQDGTHFDPNANSIRYLYGNVTPQESKNMQEAAIKRVLQMHPDLDTSTPEGRARLKELGASMLHQVIAEHFGMNTGGQ